MDAFAVGVPAVVELALVLVRPLLGDVVRRMGRPRRVVHEPRRGGVVTTNAVQPLDRLVGDVVGEVVELAVLALGNAEGGVVLGDDRVVLAGGAAEEAPPVVESPRLGPVVERARRALHVVGVDIADERGNVDFAGARVHARCVVAIQAARRFQLRLARIEGLRRMGRMAEASAMFNIVMQSRDSVDLVLADGRVMNSKDAARKAYASLQPRLATR